MKASSFPARIVPHKRIKDQTALEEEYNIMDVLGRGSFGEVKRVIHKETGREWAMKTMDKSKAGSGAVRQLEKEVAILKRVNQNNIVALKCVYETPKQMYLIMELCDGGELLEIMEKRKFYPEAQARTIIERICQACAYLHSNDIVHRDLKLENVLLSREDPNDQLNVKISDFGLSTVAGELMQDVCGTPLYMAPEVLNNLGYTQACDIWSVGVICYYILCGTPPFTGQDSDTLYERIREGKPRFEEPEWTSVTQKARHLIDGMLQVNPAARMTAREILDHPWITGEDGMAAPMPTVLEMMKSYNAERRFKRAGWCVVAAHIWLGLIGGGIREPSTPGGGLVVTPHPCSLTCPCWDVVEPKEEKKEVTMAKEKRPSSGGKKGNVGAWPGSTSTLPAVNKSNRVSLTKKVVQNIKTVEDVTIVKNGRHSPNIRPMGKVPNVKNK